MSGSRLREVVGSLWFRALVTVLLVSQAIAGVRWHLLLRGAGLERPLAAAVRGYMVGVFADYSATEATLLTLVGFAALAISSLPGAVSMLAGPPFPSRDELEAAEEALHSGEL